MPEDGVRHRCVLGNRERLWHGKLSHGDPSINFSLVDVHCITRGRKTQQRGCPICSLFALTCEDTC
ncbi:hypothetical protein RAJCM14343_4308 [Rhodococcus aetherivorans]|uniref:Uncharacterized protein n=1 Tax=Rhodococcus aetherivorans TaxID=191292 RepID=A0ABQ0YR18_9NOCA|nr:hypothetical protein RAJCM14343_4308 [Rhodococcus aetherivorans]CCW12397.1 hypothetical protein EBESD8_29460 [Rhodococcus aetherivorans]